MRDVGSWRSATEDDTPLTADRRVLSGRSELPLKILSLLTAYVTCHTFGSVLNVNSFIRGKRFYFY